MRRIDRLLGHLRMIEQKPGHTNVLVAVVDEHLGAKRASIREALIESLAQRE